MRPGFVARTVTTTLLKIKHPDTKLVIAADEDDEGTLSLKDNLTDPRIIWSVKSREDSLGAKYNRVLEIAPAEVYGVMVDYAPHITDGFDEKILEAAHVYPDGYAVIVNHLANLSFSQMNAVTHKVVEKMGYLYPPYFPYWFIDHWLEDIAYQIGRHVFCDVFMDVEKRKDISTTRKYEPNFWGQVFDALHAERVQIARSIINAPDFEATPAHKAALLRNQVLTFEWSMIINKQLASDPGSPIDANDQGYFRLKEAMIDKLVGMGLATRHEEKAKAA